MSARINGNVKIEKQLNYCTFQITYKRKIPAERATKAKAEFEDSNSKSMKNDYVKLEPRPKETFNTNDILIMDSSTQVSNKYTYMFCWQFQMLIQFLRTERIRIEEIRGGKVTSSIPNIAKSFDFIIRLIMLIYWLENQ